MTREENRYANSCSLEKSKLEEKRRIEYYRTHCPVCKRTWEEAKCGIVLLKQFGNVGICAECADECEEGLPEQATERFREAAILFHGAVPWVCANGRLWVLDSPVPYKLRTTAMRLVMKD